MSFRYIAYNEDGEASQGTLNVEREEVAEQLLWERGLVIADLRPVARGIHLAQLLPTVFGPKPLDVILFSRQLATLIESGVDLIRALRLLAEHVANQSFANTIRQVGEDLRIGTALSEALAKHPLVFPAIYCRMIEVGQRTGNFGVVLRDLATYLEKSQATLRKIQGAMAYPAFVLSLASVVVFIIVNITLPPMMGLFTEFGAELPWTTRLLIAITDFVSGYKLYLLIGIALLALFIFWYVSRPAGRRHWHYLLIKLPLIGPISVEGAVARFSRTMATLLRAGLALPESLDLTKQTINNTIIQEGLERVRQETIQGRGISDPLSANPVFPSMLAYMVRIGEETGTLDGHLATLADFYEGEVDRRVKILTGVLEPALTIFIGIVVGFVAVSVIRPMYGLLQAIR
jgi:type IV pilus assembly protein PilC